MSTSPPDVEPLKALEILHAVSAHWPTEIEDGAFWRTIHVFPRQSAVVMKAWDTDSESYVSYRTPGVFGHTVTTVCEFLRAFEPAPKR